MLAIWSKMRVASWKIDGKKVPFVPGISEKRIGRWSGLDSSLVPVDGVHCGVDCRRLRRLAENVKAKKHAWMKKSKII